MEFDMEAVANLAANMAFAEVFDWDEERRDDRLASWIKFISQTPEEVQNLSAAAFMVERDALAALD
jgi:hypothetical protein